MVSAHLAADQLVVRALALKIIRGPDCAEVLHAEIASRCKYAGLAFWLLNESLAATRPDHRQSNCAAHIDIGNRAEVECIVTVIPCRRDEADPSLALKVAKFQAVKRLP